MDTSEYRHHEAIEIDRPAADIYVLVADVSRMGEWSPVCTGGAYDEDGEWFTGTNAMGKSTWATRCRVVVADPGREFTFINHGLEGRVEMVLWSFRFEPVDSGRTTVTQTREVLPDYADGLGVDEASAVGVLDMMKVAALEGMPHTLAALKAALRISAGRPASGGPPELGEGAPGLWCEPTSQKHLRPCPP